MAIDAINHVNKCEICAKRKSYGATKAPLKSMPTTNKVMQMIAADICGPVTESKQGFKYILVITDYASRYVITVPMIDQTARTIAKHLVYDVFTIFGGASSMLTDKGANLLAGIVQTICELFGVERITTTSFHPQTDGLTERFNRTMADMLSSYVNKTPDLWCEYLKFITMAYNTTKHTSTKFSPFYLFFGRHANMPNDICPPLRYRAVENYGEMVSQQWHNALEIARENVEKAQISQKKYYDEGSKVISFEEADRVMLQEPPKPGKFNMKWEGPHVVIKKISDLNYRIEHSFTKRMQVVHINRLKSLDRRPQKVRVDESNQKHKLLKGGPNELPAKRFSASESRPVQNRLESQIVSSTKEKEDKAAYKETASQVVPANRQKERLNVKDSKLKSNPAARNLPRDNKTRGGYRKDVEKPRLAVGPQYEGRYNLRQRTQPARY
jgi:hypothetical protein